MGILLKALVPAVVLIAFALARRYFPATSVKAPGRDYSLEELDVRFSGEQWLVTGGMVTIGIIFAISTHAALVWLNRFLAAPDSPTNFILWPQSAIWWFFPGFGALALSWEITLQIWALFGRREDAASYAYWTSLKAGFDSTRLLRLSSILIVLPIGILTILALPMHVILGKADIRDCGYAFASCNVYRYSEAKRMTIIDGFRDRESRLMSRAGIVIDFSDGRRWSSAGIGDFNERVDPSLEQFLEKRTNLNCNHAQTESDIPPLSSQ